jgi:hypothetical protein
MYSLIGRLVQQLRFAAVCLAIHAAMFLLANLPYAGRTGDISGLVLLRFPIAVIIVLGLWAGVGLARWVGLLYAVYFSAAGWLSLISVLPIRIYPHQSSSRWLAIGLLVMSPIVATLAFFALIRISRESV